MAITHIAQPASMSVGQWIHTATLASDITIDQMMKKIPHHFIIFCTLVHTNKYTK